MSTIVPRSVYGVNGSGARRRAIRYLSACSYESLYSFAVRTQREHIPQNPDKYPFPIPRIHTARRETAWVRPDGMPPFIPSTSVRGIVRLKHLHVHDPASWNALALFCLPRKASLLSILLAEAGFLTIAEMVLFQALCVAPLIPGTCWHHVRPLTEVDFLEAFTGLPADDIRAGLEQLQRVGVIAGLPSGRRSTINEGVTLRPIRITGAAAVVRPDELDLRWALETCLLLQCHNREIAPLDFKMYLHSIGLTEHDLQNHVP